MDNWIIEIEILILIYANLLRVYNYDQALSVIDRDNLSFPYLEKMLDILKPWSTYLDLNRTSHVDSLDKWQINGILLYISQTEREIAQTYRRKNQFDLAGNHC